MGAWGGGILQSDQDLDILGDLSHELGEELCCPDNPAKTRAALDNGGFNKLFSMYQNDAPTSYPGAAGNYYCVMLAAASMLLGAKINDEQRDYLRGQYRRCGLMKEGIEQMSKALDHYISGQNYELEEPDRTEEENKREEQNKGRDFILMNHFGERYYEDDVGTPDLATRMVNAMKSKWWAFKLTALIMILLPLLLRWIVTECISAQKARQQTHPHTAWKAPATPACSGCGEKAGEVEKKLKTCSRCKVALYCSRDCQKQDFRKHKKVCAALANKAAEE